MTDDEFDLFRAATRDVKPLTHKKIEPAAPKPQPMARFARADQRAVLRESLEPVTDPAILETGDELSFRRAGVPDAILKKLRRGHFSVAAELDLHGLTGPQARHALREFLAEQLSLGAQCVRVIHGKGLGSGPRGPVLKNLVNRDLRRTEIVVAFGSARQLDGGSGAVYVLLNRGR